MALPATDDFSVANDPLTDSADWSAFLSSPDGDGKATGGVFVSNLSIGDDNASYWSSDAFSNNQYAQAVIGGSLGGATNRMGMILRAAGANPKEAIMVRWHRNNNQFECHFWNAAGTRAQIGSGVTPSDTILAGDIFRAEIVGNTVTVKLDYGSGFVTETTYDISSTGITSGFAGIYIVDPNGNDLSWDNWEGGNLSGPSLAADVYPLRRIPWTEQPPEGTGLDKSHPLYPYISYVKNFASIAEPDLLNGLSPTIVDQIQGHGHIDCTGSAGDYFDSHHAPIYNNLGAATNLVSTVQVVRTTDGAGTLWAQRDGANALCQMVVQSDILGIHVNGSDYQLDSPSPTEVIDGQWHVVGLSLAVGDEAAAYIDGEIGDQGFVAAANNGSASSINLSVGNRWESYPTTGFESDMDCQLFVQFLGIRLTSDQHRSLANNPWQIFEPRRQPLLIRVDDVPTSVSAYPIRPVSWTEQPPQEVPLDRSNFFGQHCVGMIIPGWSAADQDDSTTRSDVVPIIGTPFVFDTVEVGTATSGAIFTQPVDYKGRPATVMTHNGLGGTNNNGYQLHAASANVGEGPLAGEEQFTVIGIYKPEGNGVGFSGADPRVFTKDFGTGAGDHDLMIGLLDSSTVNTLPRTRVRIGGTTLTVVPADTAANAIQNDAWNLVASTVKGNEVTVHGLREDGGYATATDTGTGVYNPRTNTDMACFGTAGVAGNQYQGKLLGVWFFDVSFNDLALLQDFFENPWQVFEPQYQPLLMDVEAAVVATYPLSSVQLPIQPGAAVVFVDNGADYLNLGQPPAFSNLEEVTVWSWISLDGTGFRAGRIFSMGDNNLELQINGTSGLNRSRIDFVVSRATTEVFAGSLDQDIVPVDDSWQFIAVTWKLGEVPVLYIGDLDNPIELLALGGAASAGAGAVDYDAGIDWAIGNRADDPIRSFGGRIGAVGFHDRALNQGDLDSLRLRPALTPDTIGLWFPGIDNQFGFTRDYSPTGAHGLLVGTALTLGDPLPLLVYPEVSHSPLLFGIDAEPEPEVGTPPFYMRPRHLGFVYG